MRLAGVKSGSPFGGRGAGGRPLRFFLPGGPWTVFTGVVCALKV